MLFSAVGFHYNHPVAFIVVDHIVLHGDGGHHIQLISKVLRTHQTNIQYSKIRSRTALMIHALKSSKVSSQNFSLLSVTVLWFVVHKYGHIWTSESHPWFCHSRASTYSNVRSHQHST